MSKREIKKCVLEMIDYLGSRNGFDNWWLQIEDNEESEITKKLEDIIERRLNQNKDDYSFTRVSVEERQRERSDKYDYLIGDDDDIKLNQNEDD